MRVAPAGMSTWSIPRRLVFRFLFVYAFLYYLPFPITVALDQGWVDRMYAKPWTVVILWTARHVFHVTSPIATGHASGSGDTLFDFYRVATFALLSALASALWTVLLRSRTTHPRLEAVLVVYVRYTLGSVLVAYGMIKVFPLQFPAPSLDSLVEPLGDFSPPGLFWTWMGRAELYERFAGATELLGGVLLFFRRTTILGALVALGAMTNVVVLNFSCDIAVKLYSLHLLGSALLLLAPDARRLLRFFILNRATRPRVSRRPFDAPWKERGRGGAKAVFVLWVLGSSFVESREAIADHAAEERASPIHGIWNVDGFSGNDGVVLRRVVATGFGVFLFGPDDTKTWYRVQPDSSPGVLVLFARREGRRASISYRRFDGERLALEGTLDGKAFTATLNRVDPARFRLNGRGFHWVQDRQSDH